MSRFENIPVEPAFTDKVFQWCHANTTQLQSLSKQCGLAPNTLSSSFSLIRSGRRRHMSVRTLSAIARITGIRAAALPYGA